MTGTIWSDSSGAPISCVEKLRVLRENESELRELLQDAYDDALLMGVDPVVMRCSLIDMINALKGPDT